MTTATLRRREATMSTTFEDVENLIYDTTHKFNRRYGIDIEEGFANARLFFVRAMDSYRPEKGSLTNWIRFRVWHELLELKENEAYRYSKLKRDRSVDMERMLGERPEPGRLAELRDELSTDAKMVVHVLFSDSRDLEYLVADQGRPTPNRIRKALMEFFTTLGWSRDRVLESFDEIRRVISDEE